MLHVHIETVRIVIKVAACEIDPAMDGGRIPCVVKIDGGRAVSALCDVMRSYQCPVRDMGHNDFDQVIGLIPTGPGG